MNCDRSGGFSLPTAVLMISERVRTRWRRNEKVGGTTFYLAQYLYNVV